ncbi:hypothetical protein CSUIS_0464 [Campylobacter porcelli]|uniref:Uncharacterized protein n=1 Tax=Campylobacter porcelli TaxID=1660073 RepID=A0A1X9SVT6_9BACT|nr:hypothetical protein CSUIS_0464 [Campylobacter sp. RM6137]
MICPLKKIFATKNSKEFLAKIWNSKTSECDPFRGGFFKEILFLFKWEADLCDKIF